MTFIITDKNQVNLFPLCDFSKASNSVNHEIPFKKIENRKTDTFLAKSYLNTRTQSVKINDTISSIQIGSFDVPQGSI